MSTQAETYEPEFEELWARVEPYTMTSRERGHALWRAVNNIVDNDIPGSIVECGVWRGGSSMLAALTLMRRGAARQLVLFDTFTGMTKAGEADLDVHGDHADALMAGEKGPEVAALVRAEAGLEDVRKALTSTGYDMRLVRFVEGDVRETLVRTQTLRIALLRLDTDFYDSTLAELQHLYPRLESGGIMIIDDYGHWQGAKRAVDEYFDDPNRQTKRPLLWTIDYTGRIAVKADPPQRIELDRYDYIPPGMSPPDLLPLFPHADPGNPWAVQWDYLRSDVPHIWRSDSRHEGYVTGNASVEEAACLYTFAQQFRGLRGLEIGTHFAWTSAHLLAAGLRLDCIDPVLTDPVREAQVREPLDQIDGSNGYTLWPDYSPACVDRVRRSADDPWSFAFIDGNHDGDAPRDDARAVLPHMATDAMVVFHDLTSPHVEAGLNVFREAGWNVCLVHTMQILGVAWRGDVRPPEHEADPNVPYPWVSHLRKYMTTP